MKKILLPLFSLLFAWCFSVYAQETVLESFDNLGADTLYQYLKEGNSQLNFAENTSDKMQGLASLDVHAYLDSVHSWGTYAMFVHRLPSGATPMDWSSSDTIKLWIKVVKAPLHPSTMVFRIHIADQDAPGDPIEEWIYENDVILSSTSSWVQLKIPLVARNQTGADNPDTTGFIIAPSSWGMPTNNKKFDADKIVGWNIALVSTSMASDSMEVMYDGFERTGNKPVPFVIFNGIAIPAQLGTPWAWGNASIEVAQGAGPVPNSNALKWTLGDQYGNGWCGFGFSFNSPANLAGGWATDSLKFMMKTDAVGDSMRAQFENGVGKVGTVFNAAKDTLWHQYSLPLREMKPQDGTTGFDPSNINTFGIMTQNDSALGITGKVAYISNVWTGNPKLDFIPPVAPQAVMGVANNNSSNTIIWNDVPGQSGESYNVYYSFKPITDITSPDVEIVTTGIVHGIQSATHILKAPGTDQNVSYYYAVVCRSAAGILGSPGGTSSPLTNMAKGVTTIHWGAPANFKADADLSEWSGIPSFRMFPSDHSGTVVQNTNIKSDTVCSADAYLAADANYLYVAFHVNASNVYYDPNLDALGNSYLNTSPDLFIGLYDWHGAAHAGLQSGAQPDYHIRFCQNHIRIDNMGVDSLELYGSNYAWNANRFPDPLAGYNVEARIPWTDLAHKGDGGTTRNDNLFAPQEGMRLPIDFEINSVSPGATQRDGQLDYSPIAEGNSWSSVGIWTYTWIGDKWTVTAVDNQKQTVNNYKLSQNYPNPFNPTTTIQYSIMQPGKVTMKVYDVLGRVVANLVNQYQAAGNYTVNFDASRLASGVYFYQIQSGAFQSVKKMMLLK